MQCPFCEGDSQVSDSRGTADGQIRRRRSCTDCKRRFTTYERVGSPNLRVVKRNGKSEPFSSDKLITCLRRVCRRRPHFDDRELRVFGRIIEAALLDAGTKSVTSGQIADQVLARLADRDPVSYHRLAASYIDEKGQLRTAAPKDSESDDGQLGLFNKPSESR